MQNKIKIGKFITFEGIDGCGKTTQLYKLKKFFLDTGEKNVIFTREPGGVKEAEYIRKIILKSNYEFLHQTEILLLLAARNEHYKKLILPSITKKKVVFCDRFIHSTYAYQCHDNANLEKFYGKIHKMIFQNFKPSLTILLDIDPETAANRISSRSKKDIYDKKNIKFFKLVRNKYLSMAQMNKKIKVLNARDSIENIFIRIKELTLKHIDD